MDVQLERENKLPEDPEKEQLKLLIKTGLTQGLDKSKFKDMLDVLEKRFIRKAPSYVCGAPENWNAHHGGQVDVVRFLRNVCGEIPYGE